ncbi:MAG: T9SS type A sorting domain-containing protein [Bacteroidetes bacterium]|jgi:hypothetical protein|nr:T9SS type A sorting domain-containing protein [Bacteroidota bacterium]
MRAALLLASFVFLSLTTFAQVQKRVMVEHFTQASCPPCAAQNPAFNQLLFDNAEKVVSLKYQTSFPGFDPMNEDNPEEVLIRRNYYGITGVPNVILGGSLDAGIAADVTVGQIDNINAEMTPLDMELTHSLSEDLDSIFVTCVIKNVTEQDTFFRPNTVLQTAIIEQELLFPNPPGSTDETDFYNVMRKMLPDADGLSVGLIPSGDSVVVEFAEPLPDYLYDYSQIGVVAFVQSNNDQEVHQAAISETLGQPEGFLDLALGVQAAEPETYCQEELTVSSVVENAGNTEINSFDLTLFANGEEVETQNFDGALMEGMSETFNFNVMLTGGSSAFTIEVSNINGDGGEDLNSLNQLDNSFSVATLPQEPFGMEIEEGFEDVELVTGTPENTVIERPSTFVMAVVSQDVFQSPPGNMGAYGNSDQSVLVDFYNWDDVGAQANLVYGKLDLTESENTQVTFDYAFAQFSGFATNDRFIVSVSEDCGENWTTVYDEGGANFATTTAVQPFYVAAPGDWASDTIDLSAYDGTAELNIRFTAQTDWGNNLYFDNINVSEQVVNSVDEPNQLEGKVFAFPNPATDLVNVEFSLVENSTVLAQVFDISGKHVTTLLPGSELGVGGHQLQWRPSEAGVYLVRIATEHGTVTKRVTVVK